MPLPMTRYEWCDVPGVDWSQPDRRVWGIPLWLATDSYVHCADIGSIGLVAVHYQIDTMTYYVARRDWRLPLVWLRFWLADRYWQFVRWLYRIDMIRKPDGVWFSWREHFRPLAWLHRMVT